MIPSKGWTYSALGLAVIGLCAFKAADDASQLLPRPEARDRGALTAAPPVQMQSKQVLLLAQGRWYNDSQAYGNKTTDDQSAMTAVSGRVLKNEVVAKPAPARTANPDQLLSVRIRNQVLANHPRAQGISVSVEKGVATLSGRTRMSPAETKAFMRSVGKVSGVTRVINKTRVAPRGE